MSNEDKVEKMLEFIINKEREAVAKKLNSEMDTGFNNKSKKVDADVIDDILDELEKIEG